MEYSKYEIVNRIVNLLNEHYINGREFGRKFGVSHTLLSDWQKGKGNPSTEILFKISEYFHVSMDYLVKGEQTAADLFNVRVESKREYSLLEKYRALPNNLKDMTDTYIDTLVDASSGTFKSVKREKKAN